MKSISFFLLALLLLIPSKETRADILVEPITIIWNQPLQSEVVIKEWLLFWSDLPGGPYKKNPIAKIQNTSDLYVPTNLENAKLKCTVAVMVEGEQNAIITKYFSMVSCGDTTLADGRTVNKCSQFSNEFKHTFTIPEFEFQAPISVSMYSEIEVDPKFEVSKVDIDETYYTDREYTFTQIPENFIGLDLIKTPNEDRDLSSDDNYLSFKMPYNGNVYIAYDGRAEQIPDWLLGFNQMQDLILTSLTSQPHLKIYNKIYQAGDEIILGANKGPGFVGEKMSNYVVILGKQ